MRLEQQVVSLELAKKLKELGVKQESYFYWCRHKNPEKPQTPVVITYQEAYENMFYIMASAFTVAELGEMLPMHHNYGAPQSGKCNGGDEYHADYVHWGNLWHDKVEFERYQLPSVDFVSKTEADARAKMLIYLVENDLLNK